MEDPPSDIDSSSIKSERSFDTDASEPSEHDLSSDRFVTLDEIGNYALELKKLDKEDKSTICYPPQVENEIKLLNLDNNNVELRDMLAVSTASSANDICNLERLETLGDSFLKFSSTLYLLDTFRTLDEGQLTFLKGQIISNKNLLFCGICKNLAEYMKICESSPCADWVPPGFKLVDAVMRSLISKEVSTEVLYGQRVSKEEVFVGKLSEEIEKLMVDLIENTNHKKEENSLENLMGQVQVTDKSVADCVEALLGQYVCGHGVRVGFKILGFLKILPAGPSLHEMLDRPAMPAKLDPSITTEQIDALLLGTKDLEKSLGYTFRDRSYLLQALTHASHTKNRLTDCYQRLEFLGDSVLDFLITSHVYENCGLLSPGDVTDLRSALVNNVTFACLTVRYGFYRHLLAYSQSLSESIFHFVEYQEQRGHAVDDELLLNIFEDSKCPIAEYIDVPKVLSDLFESLAGAVFLDCGMNLKEIWRVFYKLMSRQITIFSENVPKQAVRMLYEATCEPNFGEIQKIDDSKLVAVPLDFVHEGETKQVFGIGVNKQEAKKAAAKIAIRMMNPR